MQKAGPRTAGPAPQTPAQTGQIPRRGIPVKDRKPTYLTAPALAWLTVFMVVPCLLILVLAFFRRGLYGGIDYTLTLENLALVMDPLYAGIFLKSAWIAGLAATVAVILGYAAAYAIAAMPRRWQPALLFFAVLPFWSNYLVRTYAWIVLLNREGLITALARSFGFEGEMPKLLYTESAVVVGLIYNYLPFVILACYAPLSRLNPEISEASRDLGASGWTTFRRVTLPMTVPGIATGFVFVFVLSIGNFVTPALLGGGQFQMIGNLVYAQFLTANDWPFGAALSMVLIAIMMGLLTLQTFATERASGLRRQEA
jgi:spermidine/putrescine transport system permease protein